MIVALPGDLFIAFSLEFLTDFIFFHILTGIPEFLTVQEAVNSGKRADQRTVLVSNLIPNTGYRFRVRAVNLFGRGKDASQPSGRVSHYGL